MPLIKSGSRAAIGTNIKEMQAAGHPHKQAVAAALNNARKYGARLAEGGDVVDAPALPLNAAPGTPPTQSAAFSGPVNSSIPGRTDRHNVKVKSGSYVIPADIVSGLGEGNTAAGHKMLQMSFPKMHLGHGHAVHHPHMQHVKVPHSPHFGEGGYAGQNNDLVDIVVAGGEHILEPEQIEHAFGDLDHGHNKLDEWVPYERERINKEQAKLPGPRK